WLLGHTAFSWQDGSVGHKSTKSERWQLFSDILLIIRKMNVTNQSFLTDCFIKKRSFGSFWNQVKQHFFQGSGVNGAASGGESGFKTCSNITVFRIYLESGPFKDFLSAAAGCKKTAFSGAFSL